MFCLPKTAWPPTYEIYADVAIKYDADGSEDFVQLHIFKAKPKEDLVLTFNSDSPSRIVAMSFCEPRSW